jgi:hypothetical protein
MRKDIHLLVRLNLWLQSMGTSLILNFFLIFPMLIEIEEFKIDNLYRELVEIIRIEKFECLNSNSKKERRVYLNVTFAKGTGNLKIEVPTG